MILLETRDKDDPSNTQINIISKMTKKDRFIKTKIFRNEFRN